MGVCPKCEKEIDVLEYERTITEQGEYNLMNFESFNEETLLNPTYLKYTVYRNYGLSSETKEVKVIELDTKQEKVTLDRILYQ